MLSLDLDKFDELAEEAEEQSRSALYNELDKAFDTIYGLVTIKKVTQQRIVGMLQKAGLEELTIARYNAWWSSTRVKAKRAAKAEEVKAQEEKAARESEKKERIKSSMTSDAISGAKKVASESESTPKKPDVPARVARAQIPGRGKPTQAEPKSEPDCSTDGGGPPGSSAVDRFWRGRIPLCQ